MTTEKLVMDTLFGKTELASLKVELAFDFSNYIKQTDAALKATSIAADKLNKAAALYAEAKKSLTQFQGVPDAYQKNIDGYYKNYDKTAKELGIDTKTTQFYKEYVDVASKIGQIKDNVDQMKSAVASVK